MSCVLALTEETLVYCIAADGVPHYGHSLEDVLIFGALFVELEVVFMLRAFEVELEA